MAPSLEGVGGIVEQVDSVFSLMLELVIGNFGLLQALFGHFAQVSCGFGGLRGLGFCCSVISLNLLLKFRSV